MVKILRKLNFNFVYVTFSPILTLFLFFLTISKVDIKLSYDIKFMKKKLIHFIIKKNSLLYDFEETKLNSVQICWIFYCFAY